MKYEFGIVVLTVVLIVDGCVLISCVRTIRDLHREHGLRWLFFG